MRIERTFLTVCIHLTMNLSADKMTWSYMSWVFPFMAGATSSLILVFYCLTGDGSIHENSNAPSTSQALVNILETSYTYSFYTRMIQMVGGLIQRNLVSMLRMTEQRQMEEDTRFDTDPYPPQVMESNTDPLNPTAVSTTTTTTIITTVAPSGDLENTPSPRTKQSWDRHSEKMKIFDSTSLDKRILRKAEGALRHRTSRLILVIERCTNDHNYSAILRTAEALGIQHVWIISPQSLAKTLSIDPEHILLSCGTKSTTAEAQVSRCERHPDIHKDMTPTCNIIQPTWNHDLFWIENSSTNRIQNSTRPMEQEDNEIIGDISFLAADSSITDGGVDNYDDYNGKDSSIHSTMDKTHIKLYKSNGLEVRNATTVDLQDRAQHHLFAKKATEWLSIREFDTTSECIDALRQEEYTIWSTDLSQVAIPLTLEDLRMHLYPNHLPSHVSLSSHPIIPDKLAIVFGTESVGCTQEILQKSDLRVYLPLYGFADSLNLSVAVALVIHQLFTLDPSLRGAMTHEERYHLRRIWYTKLARQRILTSSQKQQMKRLVSKIYRLEKLQSRVETESTKGSIQQQNDSVVGGLKELDDLRSKLQILQQELDTLSRQSIEDLILHPPEPLDDMRRADEHRISYVSKNTRKRNETIWVDMPAVQYVDTTSQENKSCGLFRSQILLDTSFDSINSK